MQEAENTLINEDIKTGGKLLQNGKSKENHKRVAEYCIDNQLKKGKLLNVSEGMRAMGYASSTIAKQVSEIKKKPAFKLALNNFLDSCKEKRALTLALTTEKDIEKATLREKVYAFDIYNKNINLAEGKPTSIEAGIGQFLIKLEEASKDKGKVIDV